LAFGFRVGEGEKTLWRENVIFRFIRECIEKGFMSKLGRGKRACFPRVFGHKSQEDFLFCGC
jgi:hypothetical protein